MFTSVPYPLFFFYVNLKLQLLLISTLHKSKPACMDGATAAEKNVI